MAEAVAKSSDDISQIGGFYAGWMTRMVQDRDNSCAK
jgi:hypothetical protein